MKKLFVLFLSLQMLSLSCKKHHDCPDPELCPGGVEATLENWTGLDGCGWLLKLDNGDYLEPTNLGAFEIELEDGKPVSVSYKERNDIYTTCMKGRVVELKCIVEINTKPE